MTDMTIKMMSCKDDDRESKSGRCQLLIRLAGEENEGICDGLP